ncbi:MAG TPA: ABC transporter substrate-binding protein [Gaiellaceae bacterium]|nr:ABC transporter substrate-binding protein [Gaiellaceae bacterium]
MSNEFESMEEFVNREITRKQLLIRFGGLGAMVATPSLLAACGGGGGSAGGETSTAEAVGGATGKRGGTLTMARPEEPLSLDPIVPSDNGSIYVLYNMFDQLTTINENSTDVVPSLAESWDISPDGTIYTFHLRKGVKFSDGTPMTVDDVIFSLERIFDPKGSAYSFLFGPVKSVRATGDSDVEVQLKGPFAPFLQNLNIFAASIVPKKMVEELGDKFAQQPVGTGPFKLVKFSKGQFVHLARNENYWKADKPLLDEVMIPYVPDDNTRVLKVQAGESDVALNIPYAQIEQLDKQDDIDVEIEEIYRFDGIWLNNAEKPLDDARVRQALNYATDKEAMRQTIYFGNAEIANHMMPKMKYWRSDVEPYPFDLDKARELMGQSSAADGFTVPLVVPTGDVITQQLAQIVKESWSGIGVDVQIQNADIGTAYTNFSNFNYTAGANWYITSDVSAPDELAAIQFDYTAPGGTKSFFTQYNSANATKLIAQAANTLEESVREKAFGDLQQLVMDDAPMVALFFTPARTGINSKVQGFRTVKTAWWPLEDVSLSD